MKKRKLYIKEVLPGSIAEEAGIEKKDILLSINGDEIQDVFDYRFLTAEEELVLEIEKPHGEIWEIEIEKDAYEDLGLEFETSMLDDACSCTNQCIFCFIDQMPGGMRDTLYFKDDDSRLSFLMGNYVTLTNMKDDDLDRIIKYHMSPINVSVHTTNPVLRVQMLKNRFAGDVLDKIRKLVDAGITVNCQIVLCRGVNDGRELERTIQDLAVLYPGVRSISVVPVGLTRYREGLYELQAFDAASSRQVIEQVEQYQEQYQAVVGSRIVYLADEFYIQAGKEMPPYESYEDFPQIENGVGLISMLIQEFQQYIKELQYTLDTPRTVSIATGVYAARYIGGLAAELENRFTGLQVHVYPIINDFFGHNVTVAGLLTGGDIAKQLQGRPLGEELLLTRSMLKSGEALFLDDYTVDRLEKELNTSIRMVDNTGEDFVNSILGIL